MLRRRSLTLVAAIAVALSGCGQVDSAEEPGPSVGVFETAPYPSPNFPGQPEWHLGDGFACGFLSVPENRAEPGGHQVAGLKALLRHLDNGQQSADRY